MKDSRRMGQRILFAGFALLLLAPWPLWLVLRGGLDAAIHENRLPAAFPGAEAGTTWESWPDDFEAWLGDHAPFRNQLMTLNAGANLALASVDSSDVLRGKEGWLFLKDVSDSQSVADYQGLLAFTPEQTAALEASLAELQAELAKRGCDFVLLLAPAKEGVYARYMPDTLPVVRRPGRVQAFIESLRADTDVKAVFPQQMLAAASETAQVFYKYDTHWNDLGGYLTAQQVLQLLGKPYAEGIPALQAGGRAPADLADMSALWAYCTDDVRLTPRAPAAVLAGSEQNDKLWRFTGSGQGTLLLMRTSYGEALAPWLCEGFAASTAVHADIASPETLARVQPDVPDAVVLEYAERMAPRLPEQVDILLAWARALPL